MATRQIIVLDMSQTSTGTVVKAAFWLVAPAGRTIPLPSATSQVRSYFLVTPSEIALLQAGTIQEQVVNVTLTSSGQTQAGIQAALQAQFTTLQSALTASGSAVLHVPGSSFDGTTWTAGP